MSNPITPYLLYADVDAALEFLARAFGFQERLRYTGAEGYVSHAEMRLGDGIVSAIPATATATRSSSAATPSS